ncbi:MAG: V-type ATP synthase subunit I [Planctomycetota bacterium]|jgi:V/A-type H+-transporting ATPase subunit I
MIVPMKKVTLLAGTADRDEALKVLRGLGVLHVSAVTTTSADTAALEARVAAADLALSKVTAVAQPKPLERTAEEVIGEIAALDEEREELLLEKEEVESRLGQFARWSDVSLESIRHLREAGVFVHLFSVHRKKYGNEADAREDLYKVGEVGDDVLLAHISHTRNDDLPFHEEFLPRETQRELKDRLYGVDEALGVLGTKFDMLGHFVPLLETHRTALVDELHYAQVKAGMGEAGAICSLQGFVPGDTVDAVKAAAAEHAWGYAIEAVTAEDDAPTLIRNPKWVSIIDPVFKFLGTVPGYQEHDISLLFLLFFSLFFAMLIGDAGYGLVFLALTGIARWKMPKAPKAPFILLTVLCLGTMVWGVLTGTYFGSSALGTNSVLRSLVVEGIASFDRSGALSSSKESTQLMMGICFIIGAVHLTLAHLMAGFKKMNTLKAVGDLGWISIIWGLFFLVRFLIFKADFPPAAGVAIGVGAVLALVFDNYEGSLVGSIKDSVVQLPLSLIAGFSDIVSYMRLFAVGYTAVVLAHSFNNMASDASEISMVLGALVLFLGHVLNLVLSAMGVVVHGIRLKMLEFSGHVGNEWTGQVYNPFREPEGN